FARSTFDGAGFLPTGNSLLTNSLGQIIVAGGFASVNGSDAPNIARFNSDGTLDRTFSAPAAVGVRITGVFLQSDNKLIVAVSFRRLSNSYRKNLAPINADGSLDG